MGTGFWSILIYEVCFGTKEMHYFVVWFLLGMAVLLSCRSQGFCWHSHCSWLPW